MMIMMVMVIRRCTSFNPSLFSFYFNQSKPISIINRIKQMVLFECSQYIYFSIYYNFKRIKLHGICIFGNNFDNIIQLMIVIQMYHVFTNTILRQNHKAFCCCQISENQTIIINVRLNSWSRCQFCTLFSHTSKKFTRLATPVGKL